MKLYKNTLKISVVVFVLCVLLSIIFEFTCIANIQLIQFVNDYLIGIACSIIVVIITTFLQFKYEQKKALKSLLSEIQFFFFHIHLVELSLYPEEETPNKLWEYYYDKIYDSAKKISKDVSSIEWFSKKKIKVMDDLQQSVLEAMIDIVKFTDKKNKSSILCILDKLWLKKIKDNAILLTDSDEYVAKEITKNYDKVQCELKNLKKIIEETKKGNGKNIK